MVPCEKTTNECGDNYLGHFDLTNMLCYGPLMGRPGGKRDRLINQRVTNFFF